MPYKNPPAGETNVPPPDDGTPTAERAAESRQDPHVTASSSGASRRMKESSSRRKANGWKFVQLWVPKPEHARHLQRVATAMREGRWQEPGSARTDAAPPDTETIRKLLKDGNPEQLELLARTARLLDREDAHATQKFRGRLGLCEDLARIPHSAVESARTNSGDAQ